MTCMQCKHMTECKDDAFANDAKFCPNEGAKYCTGFEPFTNADRIRAMTDDEMADWLARTQIDNVASALKIAGVQWEEHPELKDDVKKDALEWLKQPAEEEPHE